MRIRFACEDRVGVFIRVKRGTSKRGIIYQGKQYNLRQMQVILKGTEEQTLSTACAHVCFALFTESKQAGTTPDYKHRRLYYERMLFLL